VRDAHRAPRAVRDEYERALRPLIFGEVKGLKADHDIAQNGYAHGGSSDAGPHHARHAKQMQNEIRNLRSQSQSLPDIQLSLRDSSGREVYAWKTPAPKADLGGGETIAFRARLASPPGAATAVRVVFAEAKTDKMTP
jgi:hypothetical protein